MLSSALGYRPPLAVRGPVLKYTVSALSMWLSYFQSFSASLTKDTKHFIQSDRQVNVCVSEMLWHQIMDGFYLTLVLSCIVLARGKVTRSFMQSLNNFHVFGFVSSW